MDLQQVFEKNGWCIIGDNINKRMVERVGSYISKQDSILKFLFMTNGGNLSSALCIVDLINTWKSVIKGKVYGFCINKCSSAGLIILSACDKEYRESTPHTRFLFHSTKINFSFKENEGIEKAIAELRRNWGIGAIGDALLYKNIGISKEKLLELENQGDDFGYSQTTQEMLQLGFIARICNSPTVL